MVYVGYLRKKTQASSVKYLNLAQIGDSRKSHIELAYIESHNERISKINYNEI